MDPDLMHQIVQNTTNASSIPIILNVTINPSLNATLIQPPQSPGQILLQSGGTFLAGIIALISFMWLNLRGPRIVCSPIRYMTLISTPSSSNIIPKFIISNIGGSSGVVEFIALKLKRISPSNAEFRFVSYANRSIEDLTPERLGRTDITNFDFPVLPFVIEKGQGEVKEITFTNASPDFKFIKGEYELEIKIMLQSYRGILQQCHEVLLKILNKSKDKEIIILKQGFLIRRDLEIRTSNPGMVVDPLSDRLEFGTWWQGPINAYFWHVGTGINIQVASCGVFE